MLSSSFDRASSLCAFAWLFDAAATASRASALLIERASLPPPLGESNRRGICDAMVGPARNEVLRTTPGSIIGRRAPSQRPTCRPAAPPVTRRTKGARRLANRRTMISQSTHQSRALLGRLFSRSKKRLTNAPAYSRLEFGGGRNKEVGSSSTRCKCVEITGVIGNPENRTGGCRSPPISRSPHFL